LAFRTPLSGDMSLLLWLALLTWAIRQRQRHSFHSFPSPRLIISTSTISRRTREFLPFGMEKARSPSLDSVPQIFSSRLFSFAQLIRRRRRLMEIDFTSTPSLPNLTMSRASLLTAVSLVLFDI